MNGCECWTITTLIVGAIVGGGITFAACLAWAVGAMATDCDIDEHSSAGDPCTFANEEERS